MVRIHKPRSGSMAFYPRKRAKKERPNFRSFGEASLGKAEGKAAGEGEGEGAVKVMNFLGYKAGMLQVSGINNRKNSATFRQEVTIPVTVIETPPLKVFGIRGYGKTYSGKDVAAEELSGEIDKRARKIIGGKGKKVKEKESKKEGEKVKEGEKGEKGAKGKEVDWEKISGELCEVRLLAHTQPYLTTIGKKKPEILELSLGDGSVEEQLKFAKEMLGKEIKAEDVFKDKEFLDVKGVTKGHGFTGVVKRFGIKMHRTKAKKRKIVGSIGPWHPATVLRTVARAGQYGYHSRTEYNKQIMFIGKAEDVNRKGGFKNYGPVKNDCILLNGSVPGPVKRVVAMRRGIRGAEVKYDVAEVKIIGQ